MTYIHTLTGHTAITVVPEPTEPTAPPAFNAKWSEGARNATTIDAVFNVKALLHRQEITDTLLATSFFLPKEVLDGTGVRISSIYVLTAKEFQELNERIAKFGTLRKDIYYCDDVRLTLLAARYIGVSARYARNGTLYLVAKIWYGAPPFDPAQPETVHLQNKRLHKLYKFCGLDFTEQKHE